MSEVHQVIARKWRPQKFSDVVGQTHVIRTLRNAIAGNRVGHAYLLVGPRGIGKTTIARIFAKAINCEHPIDGDPCCECASCRAIAEENSLDVIEIDAASRNSVEHMRALSEEACHMPVASKYKIYIIDEVHMLSKAAWNALLKTVEEPPSHVKFIFATTEAHLVLPTIVSRCQRFDLRPIPGNLILERLKLIADSEHVKIAPEALSAIARAAEGGMRDAQSSLEQMFSFFGGPDKEIAADQVLELFGLANAAELDALLAALLTNQAEPVVAGINTLAKRGRNLETLFDDLLEMLRGAELVRMLRNPETVLDFEEEKIERCRKLAALTTPDVLRSFMESLTPVGRILHEALNKAIYLESILLKAMHDAHAPTIGDVLARLNQLRGAGELQFISQVPSLSAQPLPAPVIPVMPPEAPKKVATPQPEVAVVPPPVPVPQPAAPPVPQAPAPEVVPEPPAPEPEAVPVPPEPAPQPAVAEVPQAPTPAPEAPQPKTAEALWAALKAEAAERNLDCDLSTSELGGFEHSVMTILAPQPSYDKVRQNRWKLLEILQKISGDWTTLLEVKPLNPAQPAVVAPVVTVAPPPVPPAPPEAPLPSAPAEPEIVPEVMEAAPPEDESYRESEVTAEPPMDFAAQGEVIDLSNPTIDWEHPSLDQGVASHAEAAQPGVKRSIVNKPEEVEATAKIPMVQKVLDLFDGEIVDIHA